MLTMTFDFREHTCPLSTILSDTRDVFAIGITPPPLEPTAIVTRAATAAAAAAPVCYITYRRFRVSRDLCHVDNVRIDLNARYFVGISNPGNKRAAIYSRSTLANKYRYIEQKRWTTVYVCKPTGS